MRIISSRQASACTLCGNVLWYPEQFLLKHVPSLTKFIDEKTVDNVRLTKIALRSQSLPKESHALSLQVKETPALRIKSIVKITGVSLDDRN